MYKESLMNHEESLSSPASLPAITSISAATPSPNGGDEIIRVAMKVVKERPLGVK